jgi:SAM-dependent methyltransferase
VSEDDAAAFYDELARDYHLIFPDWDRTIQQQSEVIGGLLTGHDRLVRRVLDCTCGIGTQAIGLASAGYDVTATDISKAAVKRCAREAAARQLSVVTGVADLRTLTADVAGPFDCALAFDNALPHLLTTEDLAAACTEVHSVLAPGGLLCVSIRDYDAILEQRPSGERPRAHETDDGEVVVFQLWSWFQDCYTARHFILSKHDATWQVAERRTTFRAIRRRELDQALFNAGFTDMNWLMPDATGFYQPIITARAGG